MNLIDQINQHKDLYLEYLGEPGDNTLRIILAEAIVSDQVENFEVGNTGLLGRPIITDGSCSRYQVVFDHYVAYAVLNESYTSGDPNDPNLGLLFRTYPNSVFLDYVRKATFATDEFPGKFTHYEIVCLDHVIEVASVNEPAITQITP